MASSEFGTLTGVPPLLFPKPTVLFFLKRLTRESRIGQVPPVGQDAPIDWNDVAYDAQE